MVYARCSLGRALREWESPAYCRLSSLPPMHGKRTAASAQECKRLEQQLQTAHGSTRIAAKTWSQMYQDFTIASLFATTLTARQHTFVDLAANHAMLDSNSYLLDVCLGWRGLCIEPNPAYVAGHLRSRSSTFHRGCVSDSEEEIVFDYTRIGQLGHISSHVAMNQTSRGNMVRDQKVALSYNATRSEQMRCQPLSRLLASANISHIDYLSLDVEDAELAVLASMNWSNTTVTLLTVEAASSAVSLFLARNRMFPVFCILIDTVYVSEAHVDAVRAWYARDGAGIEISERRGQEYLSNRTADCQSRIIYLTKATRTALASKRYSAYSLLAANPLPTSRARNVLKCVQGDEGLLSFVRCRLRNGVDLLQRWAISMAWWFSS